MIIKRKNMFKLIDKGVWKRKPYFDHYFNQIRCSYSITVNIDISKIIYFKNRNHTKLYPLLIYVLAKAVNNREEFRTAINDKGELGIWETLLPCYTVFHEENESFSNIWTEWDDNLMTFLSNYERDIEMFGNNYGIDAKPNTPANTFPISSLPWTTFTGFIWIYLLMGAICYLFLLMVNIFSKMVNTLFLFLFRFTMLFVMGFMSQDLSMKYSKYAMI